MASARLEYASVGCNRTPHCVDWNRNGLLAYGADRSVTLVAESKGGCGPDQVVAMLHGHGDRVNCVRWMAARSGHAQYGRGQHAAVELVSGSVDKNVIVWKRGDDDMFKASQTLSGHSGSVTCVAAINYMPDRDSPGASGEPPPLYSLIVSGSADSTVNIWERRDSSGGFSLLQTISFGRGFVFGLDFFELTGVKGQPILACGGDDSRVNLFVRAEEKFVRALSLSGHQDWVRDVSFAQEGSGSLLLATCSQDSYIRLWRIAQESGPSEATPTFGPATHASLPGDLKVTSNDFSVSTADGKRSKFTVTLESVLIGHEDWVYSIQWQPLQLEPIISQPLCILSTSMDKTMLLWRPDLSSGIWTEQVRVGDVGGNSLGLYGGRFCSHGNMIIGHGYQGAFHLWKKTTPIALSSQSDQSISTNLASSMDTELWSPLLTIGGHFDAVHDITWEPRNGDFLISVSTDQTSRLHSSWRHTHKSCDYGMGVGSRIEEGKVEKNEVDKPSWHEIARPQIHGYDLRCVAMVDSLLYVSGADEKVLRVFGAPGNFVGNLQRISAVGLSQATKDVPMGASVPSLGLSNKAVFDCSASSVPAAADKNTFGDSIPVFTPIDLQEPPVEAHLQQNTLWPETQKLYGHGYEMFCVDATPDGKYIASACKASKTEHASIRVWSTSTWHQVTTLSLHTLTVTQLAFSHSGELLLAVSRDRCWSLWQLSIDNSGTSEAGLSVSLIAHTDKDVQGHSRIIWSCSWSYDDSCFATGSRDKRVYVWSRCHGDSDAKDCGQGWKAVSESLICDQSVTAVDFAPQPTSNNRHILAIGLENGQITLYTCPLMTTNLSPCNFWYQLLVVAPPLCHTSTVKRLKWQPLGKDELIESVPSEKRNSLRLGTCSSDHCVKILSLTLP